MSYINHSSTFLSESEIQELNYQEVEVVGGGLAPLAIAGLVVGGVILVSFAAGVVSGYLAND